MSTRPWKDWVYEVGGGLQDESTVLRDFVRTRVDICACTMEFSFCQPLWNRPSGKPPPFNPRPSDGSRPDETLRK